MIAQKQISVIVLVATNLTAVMFVHENAETYVQGRTPRDERARADTAGSTLVYTDGCGRPGSANVPLKAPSAFVLGVFRYQK